MKKYFDSNLANLINSIKNSGYSYDHKHTMKKMEQLFFSADQYSPQLAISYSTSDASLSLRLDMVYMGIPFASIIEIDEHDYLPVLDLSEAINKAYTRYKRVYESLLNKSCQEILNELTEVRNTVGNTKISPLVCFDHSLSGISAVKFLVSTILFSSGNHIEKANGRKITKNMLNQIRYRCTIGDYLIKKFA